MTRFLPHSASHRQLLAEALGAAALAIACYALMPDGQAAGVVAALAVAYAVPRALYTTRRWCTPAGRGVFTALGALMCALAVYTIWHCTVSLGLPLDSPQLLADDGTYYRWALHHYDGRCREPAVAFPGFPLLMLASWRVLGVSVVWPLAMNVMLTLLTVVVAAATTRRLLSERTPESDRWTATVALCMCATLCYFLSQGLRLQKEALVYLSMSLIGYVLAGLARLGPSDRLQWRDVGLWVLATVMLACGRATYVYFAAIGVVMIVIPDIRRRPGWRLRPALLLLALVVPAFVLGNHLASYSVERHLSIIRGGYAMEAAFSGSPAQQPYLDLIGRYYFYPVWRRLLILPLACCVQFVIPFPWVYGRADVLELFPRLAWGWYAVGGLTLFYYTMQYKRLGRRLGLGAWGWWLAVVYMVVAYVVAGSVSRYVLPIEPLAVAPAVLVLARVRQHLWLRQVRWWVVAYAVVLVVTLVVCYHVQTAYLDGLNDYYRHMMHGG